MCDLRVDPQHHKRREKMRHLPLKKFVLLNTLPFKSVKIQQIFLPLNSFNRRQTKNKIGMIEINILHTVSYKINNTTFKNGTGPIFNKVIRKTTKR